MSGGKSQAVKRRWSANKKVGKSESNFWVWKSGGNRAIVWDNVIVISINILCWKQNQNRTPCWSACSEKNSWFIPPFTACSRIVFQFRASVEATDLNRFLCERLALELRLQGRNEVSRCAGWAMKTMSMSSRAPASIRSIFPPISSSAGVPRTVI